MWTPALSHLTADDVAAIPVALIILADRHGADERQMPVGQAEFFRPGVELFLHLGEVAFRSRRLRNVEAGAAQTGRHVLRRHEGVIAQKPEQHLAAVSAEPAASLGQNLEQPDLVGGRPCREEFAKEPCSFATSSTKRAFTRTDPTFAPLRTMRASLVSLSQKSSGSNVSRDGSKPRKASSKPGHLDSITLQAKPAENTRLVISASTRSSLSLRNALGSGFGGKRRASASAPPLRFSARARMVLNAITREIP